MSLAPLPHDTLRTSRGTSPQAAAAAGHSIEQAFRSRCDGRAEIPTLPKGDRHVTREAQGNVRPLQERHRNKRFPFLPRAREADVAPGSSLATDGSTALAEDPQPALPDPPPEGEGGA